MWWQLLVLQVGFFCLLILALKKLFHGNLLSAIRRMEGLHQQNLKKEQELKAKQEAAHREFDEKFQLLHDELEARRSKAEEEIRKMREEASQVLEREKVAHIEVLKEKQKHAERRIETEISRRAGEAALGLIEKVLSPALRQELHRRMADELLDSLLEMGSDANRRKVKLGGKAVRIRSAFPLAEKQVETLKSRVFQCLDAAERARSASSVEIRQETDATLFAGFVVELGQLILDGSLRNRLEKAAEELGKIE